MVHARSPNSKMTMLELASVTKRFRGGVTAVADFSLSLTRGVLGLLGPNGAGKTTLMQMIATITAPTTGRMSFDGVDLAKDPDHLRRRLGYLPQDFGVYDNLTDFSTILPVLTPPLTLGNVVKLYASKHNPFVYFNSIQSGANAESSLANPVGFTGAFGLYSELQKSGGPSLSCTL